MKNNLTPYGWIVVLVVFLTVVGVLVVGAKHGWYWGSIPAFIGLLILCMIGAAVSPKKKRGAR